MKRCPRCNFELDAADLKANACPACRAVLDPRRKPDADQRVKMRKDERVKRPE